MTEEERVRIRKASIKMQEFFKNSLELDEKLGLTGMTLWQRIELIEKLKREKVKSDRQRLDVALDYAFK